MSRFLVRSGRRATLFARCLWLALAVAGATAPGAARAHPPPIAPNPLDPPILPAPPEALPIIDVVPTSGGGPAAPGDDEEAAPLEERRALDPAEVTGIEAPERQISDTMREIGTVLLFPPRESLGVLFLLTRTATAIVEQQQIVPKINQFTREKRGEITLFPTLFFDPGRRPSVGALMITGGGGGLSTGLRVGTGGLGEMLLEARVVLGGAAPLPFSLVGEALYDMRSGLQYNGLGQQPETDPRNQFRPLTRYRDGRYRHQRARGIVSAGVRPSGNTELFVSSSFTQHTIDASLGDNGKSLEYVFVPGSIPGGPTTRDAGRGRIVYSEIAARLDTREDRGAPREGAYVEGYMGYGAGVIDDPTQYGRFGFRGAVFLSIFRKTNILSPKLVVDQLQPLTSAPIPFYELARESDFRGFHNRRDALSTTASLDYRWGFAPQISGRLFVDFNTVGPELAKLGPPRFAVGFGMDIYASARDIGAWAFSFSPDGIGFSLSFGVPNSFGDRQHRE